MTNPIIDSKERAEALDVNQSFIIQAPAGSGKTELLIQRILSLLAKACEEPEQIIGITFTRKAAAEMRHRLLKALQQAQTQPEPIEAHALTTWKLAKAVLAVDAQRQWQLLENPNRIRLQTIDSLCASIARSAPYLSQLGAEPKVLEDAQPAYERAARNLMAQLSDNTPWHSALTRLLLHLDNDWGTAQRLLTQMLARRDQWLAHLLSENDLAAKRQALENSLKHVITDTLELVLAEFPKQYQAELLTLLRSAAQVLSLNQPDNNPYAVFQSLDQFPGVNVEDQASWQTIANFLLIQTGEWRRSFTVVNGFLAPSGAKTSAERKERQDLKDRISALSSEFNQVPALLPVLKEVQLLPPPYYSDEQWQILEDLVILLPILAAELHCVFADLGGVDFIEVVTRARQALGASDSPTEIALNWDYRIRHILVDEFQDTSTPQFHLLEQLTAGWQANDGRSLFLVGDPMQSIYRFREAEVGLFLRAQCHGLGNIPLKSLQLQVNFRSEPRIIEWINQTFLTIFPYQDEMSVGAVSYALSQTPKTSDCGEVSIHPLIQDDPDEENQRIISIIQNTWTENPQTKIALLVRARHHASALFSVLQAHNLRYQAQDMERLVNRAVIQDCYALTRALLHPADRIAWFAILRAPWCGLSLADLLVLTQEAGNSALWPVLLSYSTIPGFSADAKTRLNRVVPILEQALSQRDRLPLRSIISSTWNALGGPACIKESADFQNVHRYLELLEGDLASLPHQLNNLFASVDPGADNRLQIMTMHKAKGLEFDVVILPGLEHGARAEKSQLLLWWERPRPNAEADLILAPIKSSAAHTDPIYQYLRSQETLKTQYETTRVLYVAATRAKKALHLLGALAPKPDGTLSDPPSSSFLALLWPHVQPHFQAATQLRTTTATTNKKMSHRISRLPAEFISQINFSNALEGTEGFNNLEQKIAPWNLDQHAEHIGTVIHSILERIAKDGLSEWPLQRLELCRSQWKTQCQQLGIAQEQLESAIGIITEAIQNTLSEEKGRWILSPHKDHQSEFPLSLYEDNHILHSIVDRTFIDEKNQRWIIDYKSSFPKPNQSPQDFLIEARQTHTPQLQRYAKAFSHLESCPTQAALYFPRCSLFCHWSF
jgi:ATP-dependent exoDNAse (exonuclease V) beta subunit